MESKYIKVFLFLLLNIFFSDSVHSLTILDSFPTPSTRPQGMISINNSLWQLDSGISEGTKEYLYEMDLYGNVINSIPVPTPNPAGLTWDGSSFWYTDVWNMKIVNMDVNGKLIKEFNSPGTRPTGITWDGSSLWVTDWFLKRIDKIDASGNVITSINNINFSYLGSVDWYNSTFWILNYSNNDFQQGDQIINHVSISGDILATYNVTGYDPVGLAYDGNNVWMSGYINNRIIYKTDITTVPEPNTLLLLIIIVFILLKKRKLLVGDHRKETKSNHAGSLVGEQDRCPV